MIDLAIKDIRMRKVRSTLTIIGIGMCVLLSTIMVTISTSVERDWENALAGYAGQIYVKSPALSGWSGEEFPPFSSSIDADAANEVLNTEGINSDRSSPILFVPLAPSPYPGAPPQVVAVGIMPGKEKTYIGDLEAETGVSSFSEESKAEAILGSWAAYTFDAKVGDEIEIAGRPLKVVGILKLAPSGVVGSAALIPLSYAQEIFSREGSVSVVLLTAEKVGLVSDVASSIRDRFSELDVITQDDMAKNLEKQLSMMRQFMGLINVTAMGVAGVIVLIIMVITVSGRTREIGTFRAIGAKKRTLLFTILEESAIIGLLGGIAGLIIFCIIWGSWFGSWNDVVIILTNKEYIHIPLYSVFSALVVGALAGLYPAYRAARVNPIVAMRYE